MYQLLSQKHHPLFLAKPPLNQKTVQAPFLSNPPYILFFQDPLPTKSRIFQWTPEILKFFILNTILSLKVTKFLGKISQFEFLVLTEKNTFAYKFFLSFPERPSFQKVWRKCHISVYFLRKIIFHFPSKV